MSLTRKLLRGSTINLAEHAIKITVMFVTTPLMVLHLGRENYGVWIVALAIIGYLRLLDLGVSLTGSRLLGRAIGAGNKDDYDNLFVTFSYLFNRIGIIALAITLILALFLPFVIPGNAALSEARWIIFGLGLATSFRFWTQIFLVVLKSHLRYDWIGLASIIKTLLQGTLIFILLTRGHGLTSLLLAYIITDVLDQVLLVLFSRKIYPQGQVRFVHNRPTGLGPILRYSATVMMVNIGSQLRNGVDPLVIGHFSGLAFVPVYSIGSRFLTVLTDIVNAIFGGSFIAAFSQLDGRNDHHALVRNFLKSLRFSCAIASLGGGAIAVLGPLFIERWIGSSFADSGKVLLILVVPTTLMLMQYPVWGFFFSQNKQRWLAFTALGGGFFNAALSIILALNIGFFGVVWATFIELLLAFGIIVPILTSRICQIGILTYWWNLLKHGIPFVLLCFIFDLTVGHLIRPDYFSLLVSGVGLGALAIPLFWFLPLTKEDRRILRNQASRLWKAGFK